MIRSMLAPLFSRSRLFLGGLGLMMAALGVGLAGPAAAGATGQPTPWQIGMQPGVSPVKTELHEFHLLLMVLMTLVVLVVLGLLGYVMWRFRAKANPEPAKFSHNTTVEVIWTVVPVIILLVIAIPSFRLMYFMDRAEDPELSVKITGYQWHWGYEYSGISDEFAEVSIPEYLSYMIPDEDLGPNDVRLLSTDTKVVLPVNTDIQFLVTAADVLHSWALPAFGIKRDAVPGRLNETWARVEKEGVYYGQCSEICGINHAFMPAEVHVVSREVFDRWVELMGEDSFEAMEYIEQVHADRIAAQQEVALADID